MRYSRIEGRFYYEDNGDYFDFESFNTYVPPKLDPTAPSAHHFYVGADEYGGSYRTGEIIRSGDKKSSFFGLLFPGLPAGSSYIEIKKSENFCGSPSSHPDWIGEVIRQKTILGSDPSSDVAGYTVVTNYYDSESDRNAFPDFDQNGRSCNGNTSYFFYGQKGGLGGFVSVNGGCTNGGSDLEFNVTTEIDFPATGSLDPPSVAPTPSPTPSSSTSQLIGNGDEVHRFYNSKGGTHLYTTDLVEKDVVISNPGWGYRYEGVAYMSICGGNELFRFYHAKKNYHFLTTSKAEADVITGNPHWGYKSEGRSFSVSTVQTDLESQAVHRFYHQARGVHFYTADVIEADTVIEKSLGSGFSLANAEGELNLLNNGWGYQYEGIAWYASV